jgi:hypothetical protein
MSRRSLDDEVEDQSENKPARPCTPVYPGDPVKSSTSTPRSKEPHSRLFGLFQDRLYHSVSEMEKHLPGGIWASAMDDLIARGMAFDRVEDDGEVYFRVRNRPQDEPRQAISDLLMGISLSTHRPSEESSEITVDEEEEFDLGGSEETNEGEAKEGEGIIVLSDPSDDLSLPVSDTIVMTAAILAQKGMGKTYLATVMAEEMMLSPAATGPVVIIDPLGNWYGILSKADGTPSPFKMLVLGGRFGDFSITNKDGSKVARIVNGGRPNSFLIDLSEMSVVEQHEFVADFVVTFHEIADRSPIHIIVDEADEFAPQRLDGDSAHQKRCFHAMDRLVRRGRARGIGTTMITQRTAVISKNLLTQVNAMFLMAMGAPNDIRAVETWLMRRVSEEHRDECLRDISTMRPGVAFFLRSGEYPMFRKFKVKRKLTYDSSSTPSGKAPNVLRSHPSPSLLALAKSLLSGSVGVTP